MGRYHIHPVLSVTVDRDDDVYVADWNTNFIHVYQEERRYIEKWRIVNFVGCSGGDFGQLRRPPPFPNNSSAHGARFCRRVPAHAERLERPESSGAPAAHERGVWEPHG